MLAATSLGRADVLRLNIPGSSDPPLSPASPSTLPLHNIGSTAEILKNKLSPFKRALTIAHVNAQSIVAHKDDFLEIFSPLNIHVILVSETWLKPTLASSLIHLEGYSILRTDRLEKRGGGICMYIKTDLKCKLIYQTPGEYRSRPEFMFVEVSVLGEKCLLATVYRPPNIGYITDFQDILENLLPRYDHVVIMGDFNTNLLDTNENSTKQLTNIFKSCNMTILNSNATHHVGTSHTCLDLMITSNPDKILTYGQLSAPGLSNHDLIYAAYSLKCPKYKPKIVTYRDFKNIDFNTFMTDAYNTAWHEILSLEHIDTKVTHFNKLLLELYDKHAPVRTARVTRPPAPWLTQDVRNSMTERDLAHRLYKSFPTSENFTNYKILRNRTTQIVRNAKIRFSRSLLSGNNKSKIWKSLRQMGIGKQSTDQDKIGVPLDDLNVHFTTTFNELDDNTKQQTIDCIRSINIPDRDQFNFSYVTPSHVKQTIRSIKSTATGVDCIGITLIIKIIDIILPSVTHLINSSLMTGVFPSLWKLALVRPLPKKAIATDIKDYRPISVLPTLSKILEKIVHKQISDYLNTHNIMDEHQSGFRPGHSTATALLKVSNDIKLAMDNKKVTLMILLDLSKAFDCVDHDILLAKLQSLNLSASTLSWMRSYLFDRQQCVTLGGKSSPWALVNVGVPQGSVLGPLLFSLYINDISTNIETCNYHLYADDLQIYAHASPGDIHAAIEFINSDLTNISKWTHRHGLKINPTKSQYIIIGHPKLQARLDKCSLPQILLNRNPLTISETVNNLGVVFDKHLDWSTHVIGVCQRVFSTLHSLKRLKECLTASVRKLLIHTLVLPIIDYCDVLYSGLNSELCAKLQRSQNACIRFIFDIPLYDHVSPAFLRLSWLRLNARRVFHCVSLLHRLLQTNSPKYLSNAFHPLASTNCLSTRSLSSSLLSIPHHRTEMYSKSFIVSTIRAWNLIPAEIRDIESTSLFKRKCLHWYGLQC